MELSPEQQFARDMAVMDVQGATTMLTTAQKWQRRNKYWLYWYSGFGLFEIGLGTLDALTGSDMFSILLTYGVGILQIPLIYLNRRSQRTHDESVERYQAKLAKAEENLRAIDPNNLLFPEIIEEEP